MNSKSNPWAPEISPLSAESGWVPAAQPVVAPAPLQTAQARTSAAETQAGPEPVAEAASVSASPGHAPAPTSAAPVSDGFAPGAPRHRSRPTADMEVELNAIVGAGTSFTGTLSFAGQIRIDGDFSGQALGGRLITIGEGARVQGQLKARRVVILGGVVKADIFASESIELYVPAQVAGDLTAPEIHLDRGVRFQGTCDLSEPSQV